MVFYGRELGHSTGSTKGKPKIEVYNKDQKKGGGGMITPAKVSIKFSTSRYKSGSFLVICD